VNHDVLAAELHGLRERVTGDTEVISALADADLGIARRTSEVAGKGAFRQSIVYNSGGCMAVYAVRALALMVVLGDEGLNVTRLHQETQSAVERISSILTAA